MSRPKIIRRTPKIPQWGYDTLTLFNSKNNATTKGLFYFWNIVRYKN